MNRTGTQIEPIEISDDEPPRGQKRKRDASEIIQEVSEQYGLPSRSTNPLKSNPLNHNNASNSIRLKRLRLYADSVTHMTHSPNVRSDISQLIVEEFPVPSSGVDDTVVQLDEWSIRRADSVIIKPKALREVYNISGPKDSILTISSRNRQKPNKHPDRRDQTADSSTGAINLSQQAWIGKLSGGLLDMVSAILNALLNSQPHFVSFSPNHEHWGTQSDEISTYAITDGRGFFNGDEIECPIDNRKGQQISSIIWGVGPTKNVIFAGTESRDFDTNTTTGKQSGYLIMNDGRYIPWKYTGAQEEVQQLTLNPTGTLCRSIWEMRDRLPQNYEQNRIAHVQLPSFTRFNNADVMSEAGLVVSAAWSPCGTYISAARDDDIVDLYDRRFLQPKPLMRLEHITPPVHLPKLRKAFDLTGRESQCCVVVKKHPDHGVTGMQWIQRGGCFAGMSLVTAGSDEIGAVRLWDVKQGGKSAIVAQLEVRIFEASLQNTHF
ncbi:4845_t:CDS:2 [Acaulospora colombiana]|uniref:4845_t:CDS:1 n=1 Tax=Acaulospora colombiana TaxID=27376 RepID=A0ACA9MRJ6_9GLOM|nr:4845_t:CDS:2 [Acaulospora colombiana]